MVIEAGNSLILKVTFRDDAGALFDPTEVELEVKSPVTGAVTTPVFSRTSKGKYRSAAVPFPEASPRPWRCRWSSVHDGEQAQRTIKVLVKPDPFDD